MPGMKYGQDDGLNGINDTSLPYREASVEAKRSIAGDGDGLAKEKFHDGDVRSVENVPVRRLDEYEVDFSDTRNFCILRWVDIVKTTTERLNASDRQIASKYHDWQDLAGEIQAKLSGSQPKSIIKRHMNRIQPLPRVLATFTRKFSNLVASPEVSFEIIWGLIYLNLKLSYLSSNRLGRTVNLLHKIRRLVEVFTRCLDSCDEPNEARIAAVDFLGPLMIILADSIIYLHEYPSDRDVDQAWPDLNESISNQLSVMDLTIRDVNDMTIYSKLNLDRQVKNMSQRYALVAESDEPGTFPNKILPFQQNQNFYGRKDELEKIYQHLLPKGDQSYRTYTIYGRQGVGKTEIALQFAYTNLANYDAVFWIQCETSVAIRQSFTDVAISLNLPGADRDRDEHHEENLLTVKRWLRMTRKRWLLIFDNAENPQILNQYWPMGASGAILLTSRKYYHFSKDLKITGDTIKPFDSKQSWELLLQLLGEDWKRMDREGKIPQTEVTAAKSLLEKIEGLALDIQQTAILIKDSEVSGSTIAKTFEMFKERIRTLPERYSSVRSDSERALDALWDVNSLRGLGSKYAMPTRMWHHGGVAQHWYSKASDRAPTTSRGIKGKVKGRDVWAFGDTGAGQNIISARHAEELGLEIHKSPRKLRMGNSKTVFSRGIVNYPWAFSENPDESMSIIAHVLDGFGYDLLLGNPFLKATQTMTKHITRFVKGVFSAYPRWALNLLGETSHRLEGLLGGSVRMQGLPDIGSSRNMMNEDWAKVHRLPIKSGRENCGIVHFPDGTTVATTGQVYTTITLPGGDAIPIVFEVLPNCYVPVVLGEDFVFDNEIFSTYADSLYEVEGFDCSNDLLLMDYQQPWYATVAEKAKLLLQPKLWKHKATNEPQSAKVLNDVMELERQHQWDLTYQYGRIATRIEWDAEHNRREKHELRKYPQWRLGPNQTLIKHGPRDTIFRSEDHDEHPHNYAMFGADEAALWRAEWPAEMT